MFLESSNLSFPTNSPIAQMEEADALEASQYRFESDWGYKIIMSHGVTVAQRPLTSLVEVRILVRQQKQTKNEND